MIRYLESGLKFEITNRNLSNKISSWKYGRLAGKAESENLHVAEDYGNFEESKATEQNIMKNQKSQHRRRKLQNSVESKRKTEISANN